MTARPTMTGFGNQFASEAVAGALPVGRNSPQRAPLRPVRRTAVGQRLHRAARREPAQLAVPAPALRGGRRLRSRWTLPLWKTGAAAGVERAARPAALAPGRRCPRATLDFIDGLRTLVAQRRRRRADRHRRAPGLSPTARWTGAPSSMPTARCWWCRSSGALHASPPNSACSTSRPGEIALLPRGLAFKVAVDGPSARLCLRELRRAVPPARAGPDRQQRPGQPARLRGPGGRLRGRRRATTRSSRSSAAASGARRRRHTPFNVVAWHGNLAPLQVRHARTS